MPRRGHFSHFAYRDIKGGRSCGEDLAAASSRTRAVAARPILASQPPSPNPSSSSTPPLHVLLLPRPIPVGRELPPPFLIPSYHSPPPGLRGGRAVGCRALLLRPRRGVDPGGARHLHRRDPPPVRVSPPLPLFFLNCRRVAGGARGARAEACLLRFCGAPDGCLRSSSSGKPWTSSWHQKRATKAIVSWSRI